MWLYLVALVLVILGVAGGVASGGIFTIILVPLGLIVAGSAVLYASWGRSAQGSSGGDTEAAPSTNRPLPHSLQRDSGHVPTSPEGLADARRGEQ
ncbi:MAG: hypothetical protein M3025_00045 [Actinomycetota bacterium]|nr:hypothetical protein [Actinomycetota bacterium]